MTKVCKVKYSLRSIKGFLKDFFEKKVLKHFHQIKGSPRGAISVVWFNNYPYNTCAQPLDRTRDMTI